MNPARTLRTLAPLRWSQPLWRLRYAGERWANRRRGTAPRRWEWPGEGAPPLRPGFPELPPAEAPGPGGERLVELLERGVFEHLEEAAEVGRERPDWRLGDRAADRLWTITLHYHGWAWGLARQAAAGGAAGERAAVLFRHYVGDWIRRASLERPGSAALAWNAYATATRIGWWVRAYHLAGGALFAAAPRCEERFLRSLWQQASWLAAHLEWDLRANHLMRDLAGLAVAGRFFAGPVADRWLARASRLALAQAAEQILPDGGHFERSPKYHLDVMEDLLTVARATGEEAVAARLAGCWAAAAEALAWMRHPDGDLAQLNDGSRLGREVVEAALVAGHLVGRPVDPGPRRGGRHLADTGLVVWHGEPWSVLFDVGETGPAVQPGHAHADTLTLECSLRGARLVVDPGSFGYDAGPRRDYDRSTAAHSTVAIDDADSSEVWHVFRLGRRARPREVTVELRDDGLTASASHDGYRHLPGRPRHRRRLEVSEGGSLRLADRLEGGGHHRAEGGLLIEPGWAVEPQEDGWLLRRDALRVRVRAACSGGGSFERWTGTRPQHPVYGVERPAPWLGWRWSGEPPCEVATELVEA
ncbi:MAG TPA: alginate lyase family protein [Thermoanaerobaculia bacterium]|nr:alginate lyase family protein [Thermoanaerobaculia bacterium]